MIYLLFPCLLLVVSKEVINNKRWKYLVLKFSKYENCCWKHKLIKFRVFVKTQSKNKQFFFFESRIGMEGALISFCGKELIWVEFEKFDWSLSIKHQALIGMSQNIGIRKCSNNFLIFHNRHKKKGVNLRPPTVQKAHYQLITFTFLVHC